MVIWRNYAKFLVSQNKKKGANRKSLLNCFNTIHGCETQMVRQTELPEHIQVLPLCHQNIQPICSVLRVSDLLQHND